MSKNKEIKCNYSPFRMDEKVIEVNSVDKELLKYKKSFYLIKKALKLIQNHYYKKINMLDAIRRKEKMKLFYLKKKNIILEDKCSFYLDHVEEISKIFSEQIKMKTDEAQCLQEAISKMSDNRTKTGEPISILKLREEQLERLSRQLNTINSLYLKQVENNKKLMQEMEEINKNLYYQNNKLEEQKKNVLSMKQQIKFYKKYNRNRRNIKINYENIKFEEVENSKNTDICLSVLCFLKTELEIIDNENKNNEKKKVDSRFCNNSFKKLRKKKCAKNKKNKLFDDIDKKGIFSFYKERFLTQERKMKLKYKRIFSFPLHNKKKSSNSSNENYMKDKHNIKNEKKGETYRSKNTENEEIGKQESAYCQIENNKRNKSGDIMKKITHINLGTTDNILINKDKCSENVFDNADTFNGTVNKHNCVVDDTNVIEHIKSCEKDSLEKKYERNFF